MIWAGRRGERRGIRSLGEGQRGYATAELAITLPVLVLVLGLLLSGVAAAASYLQCMDAARLAARAVARGESIPAARQAATHAAPEGATVAVDRGGGLVRVRVAVSLGPGHGVSGLVPGWRVAATAASPDERW